MMIGSAVGALLAATSPLQAQSLLVDTDTDVTVQQDAIEGTAVVLTSGGDATVHMGTITTPYPVSSGVMTTALHVSNAGPGAATITSGTVQGIGDGEGSLAGIYAATTSGMLSVDSGSIASRNATGLFAQTTSGNISVKSTAITGEGFGEGIAALSGSGAIGIDSGSINNQGTGIFANTSGTIAITSADVASSASMGILADSSGGMASVSSGRVAMTGIDSAGIFARGNGVTVVSDELAAGLAGINTVSTGAIEIDSGSIAIANDSDYFNLAINADAAGAIDIRSGSIVSTGPGAAIRAFSSGGGAIAIDGGTISTTGDFGDGIRAWTNGAITIAADTISGTGENTYGVSVTSGGGDTSVTTGSIETSGAYNHGIYAEGGSVTVSSGDISSTLFGIDTFARDSLVINSAAIALEGVDGTGGGISAVSFGDLTLRSGAITNTGAGNLFGIIAQAVGGAPAALDIESGTVATVGDGAYGILAISAGGTTTITSDSITTVGGSRPVADGGVRYSNGIWGVVEAGSLDITSGTISTTGPQATGIEVEAGSHVRAFWAPTPGAVSGDVKIVSGTITTTGAGSHGIRVGADSAVDIASSAITLADGNGIEVSTDGPVTIASDTIALDHGTGVLVNGGVGDVAVTAHSVTIGDTGNQGIFVLTTSGNIGIDAGTVTTAATELHNDNSSDGVFGFAAGDGAVTITAGTVAVNGPFSNAVGGVGGGAISLTSGTASATGDHLATIYGYSRHADTTITAGTTTATGIDAGAIVGHAVEGDVTITSDVASTTDGTALQAYAAGTATINSGSVTGAGNGFGAILAIGGQGVVINAADATSSGDTFVDENNNVYRADAIQAIATNGTATVNVGNATASGAGADAVHVIANGTGGAATVTVTGTVSSASGYGIFIDPPGSTSVAVGAEASVTGALGGLHVESGTGNSIVNAGAIASSSDAAALTAFGATHLDNAGIISSKGERAVALDATDDVVTLRAGSLVNGVIAGGGGADRARLVGSLTEASTAQTIARFQDFNSLDVVSGYWRGAGAPSAFNSVAISSDATLELAGLDGGLGGVVAPTIAIEGTLSLVTAAGEETDLQGTQLTGAGRFAVDGAGSLTIGSNQSAFAGTTDVRGTLVLSSALGGDLVTREGGTFVLENGAEFQGDITNDGTFVYDRTDSYTLAGDFSGSGVLVKNGNGTLGFDGSYDFVGTTTIVGGSLRFAEGIAPDAELDLAGSGSLDLSGQENVVSGLSGSSEESTISVSDGALTVDQNTNTAFAGAITGSGSLTKSGTGTLNLTGVNTYTGPTSVTGGTLSVNGSVVSTIDVAGGGALGGNGTVGTVVASNGGIIGPGNSIGTLHVAGDVTFGPGSIYQVEADATGAADQVVATGSATLAGGAVQVLAAPGDYARLTSYTILTAEDGVSGTFGSVTSDLAYLTPVLSYDSTSVTLTLARNDIRFASLAATPNQAAVAAAVEGLGLGNSFYDLVLTQNDVGAVQAFDALSGESQAGVATYLIDENREIRFAFADRMRADVQGISIWIRGLGTWTDSLSGSDLAKVRSDRRGTIGGVDFGSAELRVGIAGGYIQGDIDTRRLASHADVETKVAGVYASWTSGALSARLGGSYAWHDVDTSRTIAFPGFSGVADARYDAHSTQIFGEASYVVIDGPISIEPYIGLAHDRTTTDRFAETGTPAALDFAHHSRDVTFASAGLRAEGDVPLSQRVRLQPHFSAGYMHGWGDLDGSARATLGGGSAFSLQGVGIGRDTVVLDGGFDLAVGKGLRIGSSFSATLSQDWASRSAQVTVGLTF